MVPSRVSCSRSPLLDGNVVGCAVASGRMRCAVVSRRLMLLAVVVAGLGFAGCGSRSGSGMMGAGGNSTVSLTGAGMMGAGAGYHFARMTCSAPRSLPGRVVNVTLGDMGMARMMSGTAPMGAHMMLRISAATVPAGRISLVASNMGWRTHEFGGFAVGCRSRCGATRAWSGTVSWTTLTLPAGHYELI